MEKDKNREEEFSDNENIDYSSYSNQPEKLFSLAKEQFKNNNFIQGIIILDKSINYAIKKYGGEDKIEMAQFYNKYANGLIQKLTNSNEDILNLEKDKKIKEQESKDGKSSQNKNTNGNKEEEEENNKSPKNKKEENEEITEPEDSNEVIEQEVAFENLIEAKRILKNYLKKYDGQEINTLDNSIIGYYLELSENYYLLASLQKFNSNFEKADNYFTLCSEILKKYENKFSRNLAGLYYEQAQILDLKPKKCLLLLFKSKTIIEYYLKKELDKIKLDMKIDIDEKDLDLDYISYENEKIYKNKEIIENKELINASKTNITIKEFIDMIKDIYNRIEDVILELRQYDVYLKGKKQIIKDKENQNCLNNNNEKNKKVEMAKITLITKKRKDTFNYKDDIKIPEEFTSKEKINYDKIKI